MLVLIRSAGEGLKIGDEITVTVLEVQGGSVRLGIAAPKEVLVLRKELQDRRAASPDTDSNPEDSA